MTLNLSLIAGLVVLAFVSQKILKELGSNISFIPILLASVVIVKICISEFLKIYATLSGYLPGDISDYGLGYFLKVSGICFLTQIMSEYALSKNEKVLSDALCILGRLSMLSCLLPLVTEVLEML